METVVFLSSHLDRSHFLCRRIIGWLQLLQSHIRIGCHLPEDKDRDTESEVTSDLCDRCSGCKYLTTSGQCELLKYPCLPGSEKPRAGSVYIERLDNVAAGFTRYVLGGRRPHNGNITEFYRQPSGVPISYSRWRPGQPYPGDDDSNCIMITMNNNRI
ncbi:hypothetical protein LSH36_1658g00011 [Paralvinella palmiformis]|uniref:Uncharacterized protein n=1 Tax=Paralvinella palmiformis TaxID=53620 RepID=A0AAD9IRM9_9ANNE|nr:hypothetical protein LSH36_1658g00011 [Paralvinella palmiformis]